MIAIDGVKLPSNASKAGSGTWADFDKPARKFEAAAQAMLAAHWQSDGVSTEAALGSRYRGQQRPLAQRPARLKFEQFVAVQADGADRRCVNRRNPVQPYPLALNITVPVICQKSYWRCSPQRRARRTKGEIVARCAITI